MNKKYLSYYGPRVEYYYNIVATNHSNSISVVFLGDSSGSTDYRKGHSLCRGLVWTRNYINEVKNEYDRDFAFEYVVLYMNTYWDCVIKSDFPKKNVDSSTDQCVAHSCRGKVGVGQQPL